MEKGKYMANNISFNIKVTMNERWVNDFCSMLKWMESCGNLGHSSIVGFYSDGDGDFRPRFEIDRRFEKTNGFRKGDKELPDMEVLYDAE